MRKIVFPALTVLLICFVSCSKAAQEEDSTVLLSCSAPEFLPPGDKVALISPSYYIIQLTWCSESWYCDKIDLLYDKWDWTNNLYRTVSISTSCQQSKQPLLFYWSWNDNTIKRIKMNKWFSPKDISDKNVFYIEKSWTPGIALLWNILTSTCFDNSCKSTKEIWKFLVDARSQTVSRKNCKFYDDDLTKCKEREN